MANGERPLVALFVLTVLTLLSSASLLASSADVYIPHHAISQGRSLTPAGALVLDRTTRRPAVGVLAVDFVRSPDTASAPQEGASRFLVAINSGYCIQFNSATNKAQQPFSVIYLNARPAPVVVQNVYPERARK